MTIVKYINVHQTNMAVVQNNLASNLKQFILGVTGEDNLSKDVLHSNSNFMALRDNKNGCTFLRKVMLKTKIVESHNNKTEEPVVNFIENLNQFEDRFLSNEEKVLLISILESLAKGKLLKVQRTIVKPNITGNVKPITVIKEDLPDNSNLSI